MSGDCVYQFNCEEDYKEATNALYSKVGIGNFNGYANDFIHLQIRIQADCSNVGLAKQVCEECGGQVAWSNAA